MGKTDKKQSLQKPAKAGALDIAEQLGLKPGQSLELLSVGHGGVAVTLHGAVGPARDDVEMQVEIRLRKM